MTHLKNLDSVFQFTVKLEKKKIKRAKLQILVFLSEKQLRNDSEKSVCAEAC